MIELIKVIGDDLDNNIAPKLVTDGDMNQEDSYNLKRSLVIENVHQKNENLFIVDTAS